MDVFELVAKLSLDSSSYEQGLKSAKGIAGKSGKQIAQSLNNVANKFLAIGAVAAGAAVAGLTAFTKAAVKTGMQFDSAMSQVAATMGTTVDEIGELRDFAQQMGATTAFSATQAAEALNYMALAGYDAETSMATLPTVLDLAAAGGMDLARASDMVTDAQSALGLTLPQTTEMVDQMAMAASKSNTSVEQLGDAFLTIGATARNLKGGTVELSTILGVLADNGIKGAEGGTHLRNMILSLQNPTKESTELLKKMNISLYDSDGEMRSMIDIVGDLKTGMEGMDQASKDAIISGIFNKTDLAAVNALVGTSASKFDELTKAITDSKGAAEKMADVQLDNLAGDITLMQSAMEGAKIALSDGLSPAIRNIVQKITAILSKPKTQKFLTEVGQKIGDIANTISHKLGNAIPRILPLFDQFGKKIKIVGTAVAGAIIAVKAAAGDWVGLAKALAGLTAVSIAASLAADDLATQMSTLSEKERDAVQTMWDLNEAYEEAEVNRQKQNRAIDEEASKTEDLWKELQTLADANGRVKDSDKDRANFILGELNAALGTEYSMNGNIISQYQDMQAEVKNLIALKRAQKKLEAAEANYNTAKDALSENAEKMFLLEKQASDAADAVANLQSQMDALGHWENGVQIFDNATDLLSWQSLDEQKTKQEKVLTDYLQQLEEAKAKERGYYEDIAAYEAAELAFSEEHYDKVSELLDKDALTRAQHALEMGRISEQELNDLKHSADVSLSAIERYRENLASGQEGYTKEGLAELESKYQEMMKVIEEGEKQIAGAGTDSGEGFSIALGEGLNAASTNAESVIGSIQTTLRNPSGFGSAGASDAAAFVSSFNSNMKGLKYPTINSNGTITWNYAAIGLDFIPYNNFPAMLHRGEAVLTASEADEWRKGDGGGGNQYEINQYIESVPQTPVELADATAAAFERFRWAI